MRYELSFERAANKDIARLPLPVRRRIASKLSFYLEQKDPLAFAVVLVGKSVAGQYRFRVGDYRIIFDVEGSAIIILHVEHRRDVYRRH